MFIRLLYLSSVCGIFLYFISRFYYFFVFDYSTELLKMERLITRHVKAVLNGEPFPAPLTFNQHWRLHKGTKKMEIGLPMNSKVIRRDVKMIMSLDRKINGNSYLSVQLTTRRVRNPKETSSSLQPEEDSAVNDLILSRLPSGKKIEAPMFFSSILFLGLGFIHPLQQLKQNLVQSQILKPLYAAGYDICIGAVSDNTGAETGECNICRHGEGSIEDLVGPGQKDCPVDPKWLTYYYLMDIFEKDTRDDLGGPYDEKNIEIGTGLTKKFSEGMKRLRPWLHSVEEQRKLGPGYGKVIHIHWPVGRKFNQFQLDKEEKHKIKQQQREEKRREEQEAQQQGQLPRDQPTVCKKKSRKRAPRFKKPEQVGKQDPMNEVWIFGGSLMNPFKRYLKKNQIQVSAFDKSSGMEVWTSGV